MGRTSLASAILLLALTIAGCDNAANSLPPEQAAFLKTSQERLDKIKDDLGPIYTDLSKSSDLRPFREAVGKALTVAEHAVSDLSKGGSPSAWEQKKSAADAALKDLAEKADIAREKAKMPSGFDAPAM